MLKKVCLKSVGRYLWEREHYLEYTDWQDVNVFAMFRLFSIATEQTIQEQQTIGFRRWEISNRHVSMHFRTNERKRLGETEKIGIVSFCRERDLLEANKCQSVLKMRKSIMNHSKSFWLFLSHPDSHQNKRGRGRGRSNGKKKKPASTTWIMPWYSLSTFNAH